MAYEAYATAEYYKTAYGGTAVPDGEIEKALKTASRHIDSLTCNRIVGRGIGGLTEFQREIVMEACCEQADFEYENRELFDSALSGYSINGVNMQFGNSPNFRTAGGIPVKNGTYAKLEQTGLCCRIAGV